MQDATKGMALGPNAYRVAWRQLRGSFVLAAVFSAAINVLMLTGSIYMLQVYDRVLSSGSLATLQGLFTIVVVLYIFLGFYEFLRARSLSRAAVKLDLAVGPEAFRLWLGGVAAIHRSDEASRPEEPLRDLEIMRSFLSGPAIMGLFDAPWIPLYFLILFMIHPWLGVLTLVGALIVALAAWAGRVMTRTALGQSMGLDAGERQFADAARRGAEVIAALGMQGRVGGLWRRMHISALAAGQGAGDTSEVVSAFSKSFRMLLQSATLSVAAILVIDQKITGGMIVASSIIAGRALAPIDQIIGQWRGIGRALVAHRRLIAYFDSQPVPPARISLPDPTGQISVSRVTKFVPGTTSKTDQARILTQVSFDLVPGDGLGVIGNSASGKSTLARLLVGAWNPDSGEIRLDGATPDQWGPEVLGRSIGYLPQQVEMLPGSIRDNIGRFDPRASDELVIAAARLAGVHEMILRLPAGYATRLGGPEQPLSGGQIQRLGLARALFGNPRLVVLDEPNSNLDVSGDNALAEAISTMRMGGATVIVMAHRPSAIAAVNKVLILHGGMVAAFGDKNEILAAAIQGADPAVTGGRPAPVTAEPASQTDGGSVSPNSAEDLATALMPDTGRAEAALVGKKDPGPAVSVFRNSPAKPNRQDD